MEKILVSACLYGVACRYDGLDKKSAFIAEELSKYYDLVAICPEVEGGLPIPRPKCEIKDGKAVTEEGKDCTKNYIEGAKKALALCRYFGISKAILKDGSPSCGSRYIYNGSFKGNKISGLGFTARYLIDHGIAVYSDEDALEFLIPKEEGVKREEGLYTSDAPKRKKPFPKKKRFHKKTEAKE